MALPIVEKAAAKLARKPGESARDAARRAMMVDAAVNSSHYGSRYREQMDEPEPADLHEARKQAAKNAASGGAGSMGVPRGLADMLARQNAVAAVKNASAEEIVEAIEDMSREDLDKIALAIAGRKAKYIMDDLDKGNE